MAVVPIPVDPVLKPISCAAAAAFAIAFVLAVERCEELTVEVSAAVDEHWVDIEWIGLLTLYLLGSLWAWDLLGGPFGRRRR